MLSLSLLSTFVLYLVCVFADAAPRNSNSSVAATCHQLQSQLSNASAVFFPGSAGYAQDVAHTLLSEIDSSVCSVEPGNARDLGKFLQTVGKNRVPFGVKGGGHAANHDFSSSTGVQVAMSRFNNVAYHPGNGTVDVGAGLIWDDVYGVLDPLNITVAGGRITTVGVAGFTLGGGISYFENQHGPTVDQLVSIQVVLPNGQLVTASNQTNQDLFFGLKGGYNNFGIVTQITFKAISIPGGLVWGGWHAVSGDQIDAVTNATLKYIETVTDPKAQLATGYISAGGEVSAGFQVFYDGPTPPPGIFDELLAIPTVYTDLGTRTISSMVKSSISNATAPATRGYYDTAPISNPTAPIINAIINETRFRNQQLANTSLFDLSYAVDVFLPNIFSHAANGSSSYPPTRAVTCTPLSITYYYTDAAEDDFFNDILTQSTRQIAQASAEQGEDVNQIPIYGNYASDHTWASQRIFGEAYTKLQIIKKKYDPNDVMGLTGGWKVTV